VEGEDARRVVLTYSIVARDADSGELGVAVQSRAFACGASVMWARPGVGAVATQAFGERSYGALGLDLLAAGKTPEQALAALVTADEQSDVRQVAIVNADGAVAAHTGEACIPDAGHRTGEGYSVQANIMRSPEVWPAMADAFESATGSLARRMLAALEAAEEAGGDWRGMQAAALLVVPPEGRPWDVVADLRVDDHSAPVKELRRLLDLRDGYAAIYEGEAPRGEAARAFGMAGERCRPRRSAGCGPRRRRGARASAPRSAVGAGTALGDARPGSRGPRAPAPCRRDRLGGFGGMPLVAGVRWSF
jgi:uncharacterized Ntn-hydrolase superfamily protein